MKIVVMILIATMAQHGLVTVKDQPRPREARESARSFFLSDSRLSACKVLVRTQGAKDIGLTLADCVRSEAQKPAMELLVPDPRVDLSPATR
jgi:hypothetical protein